jgi:hypothetical protein
MEAARRFHPMAREREGPGSARTSPLTWLRRRTANPPVGDPRQSRRSGRPVMPCVRTRASLRQARLVRSPSGDGRGKPGSGGGRGARKCMRQQGRPGPPGTLRDRHPRHVLINDLRLRANFHPGLTEPDVMDGGVAGLIGVVIDCVTVGHNDGVVGVHTRGDLPGRLRARCFPPKLSRVCEMGKNAVGNTFLICRLDMPGACQPWERPFRGPKKLHDWRRR